MRLHGAFGRTRERQLLFWPLVCTTSCGRLRPERPRAAERGRPTPRSLRLSASVEDQVGERRRRAVGLIIASSAPSLQPAFNITPLAKPGGSPGRWMCVARSAVKATDGRPVTGACRRSGSRSRPVQRGSQWIQADRVPSARSASANADGTADIQSFCLPVTFDNTCVASCQVVKYIPTYVRWEAQAPDINVNPVTNTPT